MKIGTIFTTEKVRPALSFCGCESLAVGSLDSEMHDNGADGCLRCGMAYPAREERP